jgi:hypothetical protein
VAYGVNLLGESIHTIKKKTEALLVTDKGTGLEKILIKVSI